MSTNNKKPYVIVMHCDSRIAPQQPKKAITKIMEPITIKVMGKAYAFASLSAASRSPALDNMMPPMAIKKMPPIYK